MHGDSGRNLTPGLPYRARLYGGPLDGTEAHPIAESPEPAAHITVPTAGVRMGRTHPTVVIEIETSGGLAVLPLIVSEPAPRTLMPVRKERAEAIVAALRRHVQSV